jgi:hypothetical protein
VAVLLLDEAVGKSRLRKAALRSQSGMSERLGATASGETGIPRRMRWPISEPTLRSDSAGSPGVFPTASDERGTDGAQLDVHSRSTAPRGAIQPGGLCCPRPATQPPGEAGGSPVPVVRRRAGAARRCSCAYGGRSAAVTLGPPEGLARRLSRAAGGEAFGRSRSPPPVSGLRACPRCAARGFGRSRAGPPARWRSPAGRRRWPSGRAPPIRVD